MLLLQISGSLVGFHSEQRLELVQLRLELVKLRPESLWIWVQIYLSIHLVHICLSIDHYLVHTYLSRHPSSYHSVPILSFQ